MTAKYRAEKSYSHKRYFEKDGCNIVKKIAIVCKSKILQVFNWVIR